MMIHRTDIIAGEYTKSYIEIVISIVLIIAILFCQSVCFPDSDFQTGFIICFILFIVIVIAASSIIEDKKKEKENGEEELSTVFTNPREEEQRKKDDRLMTGLYDPDNTAGDDRQVHARKIRVEAKQPKAAEPARSTPPRVGSHDRDTVEVTVESTIPMASFIMSIDGRVVGYIGQQRSVLTIPSGMHQMTMEINDSGRKKVYDGNVLFNTGKVITISKRLGGYSVKFV